MQEELEHIARNQQDQEDRFGCVRIVRIQMLGTPGSLIF